MKWVLLLICVGFGIVGKGQLPLKDGKIFYEQIDSLLELPKDEIYNRSKHWVVESFKDAKEVIQLDSKEDGEIIGKGNLDCTYYVLGVGIPCRTFFTIKLNSKDGKHRVQLYDFSGYRYTGHDPINFDKVLAKPNASENRKIIEQINGQIKTVLAGLRADLSKTKDDF